MCKYWAIEKDSSIDHMSLRIEKEVCIAEFIRLEGMILAFSLGRIDLLGKEKSDAQIQDDWPEFEKLGYNCVQVEVRKC